MEVGYGSPRELGAPRTIDRTSSAVQRRSTFSRSAPNGPRPISVPCPDEEGQLCNQSLTESRAEGLDETHDCCRRCPHVVVAAHRRGHLRALEWSMVTPSRSAVARCDCLGSTLAQPCFLEGQPWKCGESAQQQLRELVGSSMVECSGDETDQYGAWWLSAGRMASSSTKGWWSKAGRPLTGPIATRMFRTRREQRWREREFGPRSLTFPSSGETLKAPTVTNSPCDPQHLAVRGANKHLQADV